MNDKMVNKQKGNMRLPPEVTRALYVRNLPFKISPEELYDIFGKFGPIRQIRIGTQSSTRGKAYVVYEDIYDAKNAVDHLKGFNIGGRYIIVLYHQPVKKESKMDTAKKLEHLNKVAEKYGVDASDPTAPKKKV